MSAFVKWKVVEETSSGKILYSMEFDNYSIALSMFNSISTGDTPSDRIISLKKITKREKPVYDVD